jgi:hypothetical protein
VRYELAKVLGTNKKATITEAFLGIDEFNHPKVYTDQHATYILLIRLILLEPGTYPTRPNMGVGLVSRYRFAIEDKIEQLQSDIEDQIREYLPEFQATNVTVSYNSITKEVNIHITVDDYTYQLTYDPEINKLSSL